MKCPICKGDGGWYEPVIYNGIGGGPYIACVYCNDTGKVGIVKLLSYKLYMFRTSRIK